MCGRYYIGDYVSEKLEDITSGRGISQIKTGDVYPSQEAAVLVRGEDGAQTRMMCWGFPQSRGKGLLINARAETAMERPRFGTASAIGAAWFRPAIFMNGISPRIR